MHYSIGEEYQSYKDGMNVGLTGGVNGLRFYFAGVLEPPSPMIYNYDM